MNKAYIFLWVAIVIVAILGVVGFFISNAGPEIKSETINTPVANPANNSSVQTQTQGAVKEFSMTSFYEMVDNKPKPQYSLKEITVNKGDTVKITVTVTKGTHDFNIDGYNIHQETPLDKPTVVEFKADKPGTFIYYCSMPGHRANGHWGTLKVIE